MASLVERPDGTPVFEYGDGLPFGHELRALDEDVELSEIERARRKHDWAASAQQAIRQLAASADVDDRWRVRRTNQLFADETAPEASERQRLVGPDIISWLGTVTLRQFKDFCMQNVSHAEAQQLWLNGHRQDIDERSLVAAERLEHIGFIDTATKRRYESTIARIGTLVAIDSFDAGGMLASGYCTEKPMIGLASPRQGYRAANFLGHGFFQVAFHEYTHALGVMQASGFSFGPVEYQLLEEVMTAHVTDLAHQSGWDIAVLDPTARLVQSGTYLPERELVAGLITYAADEIPIGLLRDAYYASGTQQVRYLDELIQRLDTNVRELLPGFDAWGQVEDMWEATKYSHVEATVRRLIRVMRRQAGLTTDLAQPLTAGHGKSSEAIEALTLK